MKIIKIFLESIGAIVLISVIAALFTAMVTVPAAIAYLTANSIWNLIVN